MQNSEDFNIKLTLQILNNIRYTAYDAIKMRRRIKTNLKVAGDTNERTIKLAKKVDSAKRRLTKQQKRCATGKLNVNPRTTTDYLQLILHKHRNLVAATVYITISTPFFILNYIGSISCRRYVRRVIRMLKLNVSARQKFVLSE